MKKRNLFALCLIALVSILVFVSCMQDPILDNKAIGKWIAQNNLGDKITLEVKSDQTFTMKLEQDTSDAFHYFADVLSLSNPDDSIEIKVKGEWTASSVSEGKMKVEETGAELSFTAYDKELTLTNIEQHVSITFSRM